MQGIKQASANEYLIDTRLSKISFSLKNKIWEVASSYLEFWRISQLGREYIDTIDKMFNKIGLLNKKIKKKWKSLGVSVVKFSYITFLYAKYYEKVLGNPEEAARITEKYYINILAK